MAEKDSKNKPDAPIQRSTLEELEIVVLDSVEAIKLQNATRQKYKAAFEALKDK